MNRRAFLRLLGLAPIAATVAPAAPAPLSSGTAIAAKYQYIAPNYFERLQQVHLIFCRAHGDLRTCVHELAAINPMLLGPVPRA